MRETFDILVGIAVVLTLGFTISMWWYMREEFHGRRPAVASRTTERPKKDRRFIALASFGAIVLFSNWILIAIAMGWIGESKIKFVWVDEPPTEIIAGKHYYNERIVLDGKSFKDCYFFHVTFIFNATRPFSITDSHLIGKPVVASDNPAVTGAFLFLRGVGFISPDVPILNAPPGFHVDPPINVDKPPQ
jgi:hypothetical protein